jgi:NDP-sugar pyrophosphorylase family protein
MTTINNIQLVIPMAGDGTRFASAGYDVPKPLLPIHDRRMFEVVLGNLAHQRIHRAIIVAKSEWKISSKVRQLSSASPFPIELLELSELSEGPAHTVEFAKSSLDMEQPLVIANSDQYLDFDFDQFFLCLSDDGCQGAVLTMQDDSPKWSYAKIDANGNIVSIIEKQVVSKSATAGIYGFSKARYFFEALQVMKERNNRVNGEFYVGPVYNYLEFSNGKIRNFDMGPVGNVMHGLGVPEDYERFILTNTSMKAASKASKLFQLNQHDE